MGAYFDDQDLAHFGDLKDHAPELCNAPFHFDLARLSGRAVRTADHCFGCTAGAGSSCGGAIA